MSKCKWCDRTSDSGERWECYLIDDDGNTSSVANHIVQTVIAKYCPVCGERLEGEQE